MYLNRLTALHAAVISFFLYVCARFACSKFICNCDLLKHDEEIDLLKFLIVIHLNCDQKKWLVLRF